MAVVTTQSNYWMSPSALTFTLNALEDPDYNQVTVLSGSIVMAYVRDVIDYDASRNYRKWTLEAFNSYFETSVAKYVYARLEKSGTKALIVYSDEEVNLSIGDFYYIYLGKISASVNSNGTKVERYWEDAFKTGILNTNQFANEETGAEWKQMFRWNKVTDLIEVLKTFSSFVVNKFFLRDKEVSDIKRSTDEKLEASDSILPTSKYVEKYVKENFLSKVVDDISTGHITFKKGFDSKKNGIFGNYAQGSSGAAIYQDKDGNWHIEGDYIDARMKITAEEVEIMKASHIGGKLISTGAEMICSRIKEYDTYWRCFFVSTDESGREVLNQFRQDDQAYVETFNLVKQADGKIGNHFYWRLVIGVGDDYIDLSKEVCAEESNAPLSGDNITLLGNITDKERQGAIILSAAGVGSPFIRIYNGINSFNLPDAEIDLNPKSSKITAGSIILKSKGSIILESTGEDITQTITEIGADVDAIKRQNDNMWVLWFASEQPTMENYPAVDWDTEELREEHLQDIVVIDNPDDDVNNGRAFRFHKSAEGEFYFIEITDTYLLAALSIAVEGRDNAKQKRRNFVSQPTADDEYEVGDTWSNATYGEYDNDSLVAVSNKAKGVAFAISHWKPVSNSSTAHLKVLEGRLEAYVDDSITSAGFVAEEDFAMLFAAAVDTDGDIVKQAQLLTYITQDEFGDFLAVAEIEADQINFIGKTIINGNFVVDEFGDLFLNNLTAVNANVTGTINAQQGTIGSMVIDGGGLRSADGSGHIVFSETYNGLMIIGDIVHHEHVNFQGHNMHLGDAFGFQCHATVIVRGTTADYYPWGYGSPGKKITLTLTKKTSTNGTVYYQVPLYDKNRPRYDGRYNLVVFNVTAEYNYEIVTGGYGFTPFTLFNANDDRDTFYFTDGKRITLQGGVAHTLIEIPTEELVPEISTTTIGAGLRITSSYDNNW